MKHEQLIIILFDGVLVQYPKYNTFIKTENRVVPQKQVKSYDNKTRVEHITVNPAL